MRWDKMGRAKERGGLGFRDLEWFNLALLAKQGWRLIQNPNSLVAKILKEKYHPNAMFLEAHIGRRPSYIWRSFWNSKKLLAYGLIWRVGDGNQIRIWRDRWALVANGGSSNLQSEFLKKVPKSVSCWIGIPIGGTIL
jgi:hypothetical protein